MNARYGAPKRSQKKKIQDSSWESFGISFLSLGWLGSQATSINWFQIIVFHLGSNHLRDHYFVHVCAQIQHRIHFSLIRYELFLIKFLNYFYDQKVYEE